MPVPPASALERLEKRLEQLPMLPEIVRELMALRQDSPDYFDQVARALHADPAFATRVLQYANSAALGAARPITTLHEAMLRVGARGAVDLILAHSAAQLLAPRSDWESSLWKHSVDVAWLMRKLSVLAVEYRGEPDEAYVFGLLHDIGRFVLYLEAPEELRGVEETDWATPDELIEAEIRICGFTHSELGYLALRKWRLPDALADAVARLGSDRGVTRRELEKLALYAGGKKSVALEDVQAVMGDEAEARAEEASDAAGSGDLPRLDLALERLWTADVSVTQVLRGAMGHFQRLAMTRENVKRGESLDAALRRLRPPVHFLREQSFKAQLNRWTDEKLADALDMLLEAEALSRTTGVPAQAACGRALMNIAAMARVR